MTNAELFLRGYIRAEIESASPELFLNRLSKEGIPFWDTEYVDAFRVRVSLFCCSQKAAQKAAAHAQAEFSVSEEHPGVRRLFRLWKRCGLVAAVLLSIALTLYLQEFVWFVRVSGNESVPTEEIVRTLETLGIGFGARSAEIDSQRVKNQLLGEIGQLQWAAVNCTGGVCNVLVRERAEKPELLDRKLPCDVVACKSGTVTSMSVLEGQALCAVGDTVEAGDVLVSGVNDFVVHVQNVHAQAEIYARTWHEAAVWTPKTYTARGEIVQQSTARYLQLGRFRIKISGNSSICTPGCDKIVSSYTLTLPGGYYLPLKWIEETCTAYETKTVPLTREKAEEILLEGEASRLQQTMTAGTVLSERHELRTEEARYALHAVYACEEMIAAEQEFDLFGSETIYGRTDP